MVTDRINLRRLIGWASGDAEQKDFRIDLDTCGNGTVLMTRWEPTQEGPKAAIEQAFRKDVLSDPTCYPEDKEVGSHHRIVSLVSGVERSQGRKGGTDSSLAVIDLPGKKDARPVPG